MELRRLVADALARIDHERGGGQYAAIARTVGVTTSTVSRWAHGQTTISLARLERLRQAFPGHVGPEVVDLAYAALRDPGGEIGPGTLGVDVAWTPLEAYKLANRSTREEPPHPRLREVRHAAFHLDRRAADPRTDDPMVDDELRVEIEHFQDRCCHLAAEGWSYRAVVVASNPRRVPVVRHMCDRIVGPDVEIRGYTAPLPLVLTLLVIGMDVHIAYDHPRFERPGASIRITDADTRAWACNYFDRLFADAPFRLCGPAGVDEEGFAALSEAVERQA